VPDVGRRSRLRRLAGRASREAYRPLRWIIDAQVPAWPSEAVVPLAETDDAVLLCSRQVPGFVPQTYISELAFAHQLAEHGRSFAVTDEPSGLFGKSVAWFIPEDVRRFISPRLWDYSRQVRDFAAGLEHQGNLPFCSADETAFWENKAHMHRELEAIGAPTPATRLLSAETWREVGFDMEPVLLKEEHSAGSAGIHYFERAAEAREFLEAYPFRPSESLVMQEIVSGATRDLRLTMVGDRVIAGATYWRTKSADGGGDGAWTTTATTYNSSVEHEEPPAGAVALAADVLDKLNVRTAGIDLMWANDDATGTPLILELSPYYQPNPPKPDRYRDWSYRDWKKHWSWRHPEDNYVVRQYAAFAAIASAAVEQDLF
jgi:hypothetical protein